MQAVCSKWWIAALAAAVLTAPTLSLAGVDITIDTAPPAPRIEVLPAPRAGCIWAPGHWEWNGRFHTWVAGAWIVAHGTYHWSPARWEQVGSRWHFIPGSWQR